MSIPIGQCFPWSVREMLRLNDPKARLCHGMILVDPTGTSRDASDHTRRVSHAWIEADGRVLDWQSSIMGRDWSVREWRALWKPISVVEYALADVRRLAALLKRGPLPKKNPFLAHPEGKHHGQRAGGSLQLPGFHTASSFDKALPYAHKKGGAMDPLKPDEDCDECDDSRCSACVRRWRIDDYPVIVGIDMSGIEPEHDIDAGQFLTMIGEFAQEALEDADPVDWFANGVVDSEEDDSGDTESALFRAVARHETDPAGAFYEFLRYLPRDEALEAVRLVAEGGDEAFRIAMRVVGQFRYLKDVPVDRIVSIDYVRPFWDDVLDVQCDSEHQELASALDDMGWDVLDKDEARDSGASATRRRVWERPRPPGARIEWHGTSLRNLLLAAPELADVLPKPPLPHRETEPVSLPKDEPPTQTNPRRHGWKLTHFGRSQARGKKWKAVFENKKSGRTKTTHFGATGYEDFTMHHDQRRKENYLERHGRGHEDWEDPTSAGALSRWILWNLPSVEDSLEDFRRRFKV